MFELMDTYPNKAMIKVVGVGGGGGNAVRHMVQTQIEGIEFIVANTDAQDLEKVEGRSVLQLGTNLTKGLGAGADPEIGRQAAIEDKERIAESLEGTDMLFIAAGMGGGTGTGAAPIVAQVAKEMGILTVAVVTKPFPFELRKRMMIAEQGIDDLRQHVDSLIVIPNEKLLRVYKGLKIREAFRAADDVLRNAVQGISELITQPGLINVDFNDVRTVMSEKGMAMMGSGNASGENRAQDAAQMAISSPLLEDIDLTGARGILVNITAGEDLNVDEFQEVGDTVQELASDHATVIIGTAINEDMGDNMRVTVVATGLGEQEEQAPIQVVNTQPRQQAERKETDLSGFERPAVVRKQASSKTVNSDMDYLDIPAFLRQQND
ncbi:MAG: cell division protein FtsZ [Kangiellaceae bacterium]|jgi:cell division protein FtsZ|nr:cell division protein FtsZ [Kangiellaceae bacterium]|tara:strand:+ start:17886 stop:19022 length:1137 start_codon:yes stop_codon:yes gene_type:complete